MVSLADSGANSTCQNPEFASSLEKFSQFVQESVLQTVGCAVPFERWNSIWSNQHTLTFPLALGSYHNHS